MGAVIHATSGRPTKIPPLPQAGSALLVIFGASGDLTRRKLIPALYDLACIGCMHPEVDVLGIGRTPMTSEEFRARMQEAAAVSKETLNFSEAQWADFEKRFCYFVGDLNDA